MSRHEPDQPHLGIVGAGKIGTAIARAAVAGGYDVAISGSGAVDRIELIVDVLAPGAHPVTTEELAHEADLIVLAVPMHRFRELSPALFTDKILVDAMNYWEEIDGVDEELERAPSGTSVVVQEWFSSARVVKSLNHLGYFKFEQGRRQRGAPDRLAMAAAGNEPEAVAEVLELIDRLGFDAVDAGPLSAGIALQPNGPVFGKGHSTSELSGLLGLGPRGQSGPGEAYGLLAWTDRALEAAPASTAMAVGGNGAVVAKSERRSTESGMGMPATTSGVRRISE